MGKHRDCRGEKNGRSKLSEKKVKRIREVLWPKYSQTKIARQFGVSISCINRIISGQLWEVQL